MAATAMESLAAADTSNGETTVAPFAGTQMVTVRFAPVGVQVAAAAAALRTGTTRRLARRRRMRALTRDPETACSHLENGVCAAVALVVTIAEGKQSSWIAVRLSLFAIRGSPLGFARLD